MNRSLFSLLLIAAVSLTPGCARKPQPSYALHKIASDPAGGGDAAISPDGRSFLATLRRDGHWGVWLFDITSGRSRPLAVDSADNFEGAWSPDGRRIAYTSTRHGNKDIFVMYLASGRVERITDSPEDDEYPNFSPDGRSVVYTGGKWMSRRFYTFDLVSGARHAITEQPGKAGACSYHPLGAYLVCHSYDSGTGHILLQPISGEAPLYLTTGGAWDYKPTFSPTGQWVAFSRSIDGPSSIWLMRFPSNTAFPLTESGNDDRWPTWSGNDDRLLFHRLVEDGTGIKVLDRATGSVKQLVGREELPGQASFDPEGRRIVYAARDRGRQVLRIRAVEGGAPVTLNLPANATFPRWSPDGKLIAFAVRSVDRWDIATVRPDGSAFHNWTAGMRDVRDLRSPLDWSPDGARLVFHVSEQPFAANLYVLETRNGRLENVTNDSSFSEGPSWMPDGDSIVFMSTRGGNWTWGFFRMSLPSRTVASLDTPDYTERDFPRSARSGEMVWSAYDRDGVEHLMERGQSGAVTQLDSAGPWARWPSYGPGGRTILYTAVEHRVEFWLADHLNGPGSPLLAPPPPSSDTSRTDGRCPPPSTATLSQPAGSRDPSPVQMHHR